MKYIYLHEDDNNEMYEDNQVCTTYWETYMEAYQDVINCLAQKYFDKKREGKNYYDGPYPHTHYIVKVELGANNKETLSVYSEEKKTWIHNYEQERNKENESSFYYLKEHIFPPVLTNDMKPYQIDRYLEYRNNILTEELIGYKEFCQNTLFNYIQEETNHYLWLYNRYEQKKRETENYYDALKYEEAADMIMIKYILPSYDRLSKLCLLIMNKYLSHINKS